MLNFFFVKAWPIAGGLVGEAPEKSTTELIITGWGFYFLCKLHYIKFLIFSRNELNVDD